MTDDATISELDHPRGGHPLVSCSELARLLAEGEPPLVLDVRWQLGRLDGRAEHERLRIPGSRYVDLERELASPAGAGGRHPLPDPATLRASMDEWGVVPVRTVVAYDDVRGLSAARLWWLLRFMGHDAARVLDGGLASWVAEGLPTESGTPPPASPDGPPLNPPSVPGRGGECGTYAPGAMPLLDAAEAAELARNGVLLDARAAPRYRGDEEPVDRVGGHIPGALSAPASDSLAADGRFLPAGELRRHFAALGVDGSRPVGVYCGSGVTAAHEVLALELAGLRAALYAGSWSGWIADPSRAVATGADPG
ncbi:MAG TPA: sulfurtransferase [Acidimicrobiales bacterium]|nr:sulfurtransferase [Acidimicrobiales bacterium]